MRKRPFALWGLTQGHVIAASLMTEFAANDCSNTAPSHAG